MWARSSFTSVFQLSLVCHFRPVPIRLHTKPESRRVFIGEVTSATTLPEIGATIPGAWTMSREQWTTSLPFICVLETASHSRSWLFLRLVVILMIGVLQWVAIINHYSCTAFLFNLRLQDLFYDVLCGIVPGCSCHSGVRTMCFKS